MRNKQLSLLVVGSLACQSWGAAEVLGPNPTETITSIEQTDQLVRQAQSQFWQIVPPGMPLYVHTEQKARPMVWTSEWPDALKKQTYPEMQTVNGFDYPIYRLWVVADPKTGDLTYLNLYGEAVWTSPAPAGYSPYGYLMDRLGIESEDELTEDQKQLSASNVGMEIQLTIDSLYDFYAQDAAAEAQASSMSAEPMMMTLSGPPPIDGTSTNSGTGGGTGGGYQTSSVDYGDKMYIIPNLSSFEDGWLELTNTVAGQEYEVYFTYNLQYVGFDTNTTSYSTAWLAQKGITASGDSARWYSPMVAENDMNRSAGFFRAYAVEDSDSDGLSDIYELMISKTDPNDPVSYDGVNLDSDVDPDGDGLTIQQEYDGVQVGVFTHPRKINTDGDGENDGADPWPMDGSGDEDTDRDRMPDDLNGTSTSYPVLVEDDDDDNDRFTDAQEAVMNSDSKDAASPGSSAYTDSDGDGLFDWEDPYPNNPDGDGDEIGDGYEVKVLSTPPDIHDNHDATDIAAYNLVKDDADSDSRPQWVESDDATNPNDGLDFETNIF